MAGRRLFGMRRRKFNTYWMWVASPLFLPYLDGIHWGVHVGRWRSINNSSDSEMASDDVWRSECRHSMRRTLGCGGTWGWDRHGRPCARLEGEEEEEEGANDEGHGLPPGAPLACSNCAWLYLLCIMRRGCCETCLRALKWPKRGAHGTSRSSLAE